MEQKEPVEQKESIRDVKHNIEELRNRISKSQDFKITVHYIDKGKEEHLTLDRVEFSKKWMELSKRKLWKLHFDLGSAYIINHNVSLKGLDNNIEKLMLEIGKLDIILSQRKQEPFKALKKIVRVGNEKPKPEPMPEVPDDYATPNNPEAEIPVEPENTPKK